MSDNKIKPITPANPSTKRPADPKWLSNKSKSSDDDKGGKSFQDCLDKATKKDQGKKK